MPGRASSSAPNHISPCELSQGKAAAGASAYSSELSFKPLNRVHPRSSALSQDPRAGHWSSFGATDYNSPALTAHTGPVPELNPCAVLCDNVAGNIGSGPPFTAHVRSLRATCAAGNDKRLG
jgi:hypothetical protein